MSTEEMGANPDSFDGEGSAYAVTSDHGVVEEAEPSWDGSLAGEGFPGEGPTDEAAYETAVQEDLPLVIPIELTGEARVDAALERLTELDDVPVAEHVEVFADIHARLTGALADLGEGS